MSDTKIRKKDIQEARRPDAVLVGATGVFDWIVERRNLLLGALAAVVVVVAVGSFISSQNAEKKQETGGQLAQAMALVSRPVIEGSTGKDSFPSIEAKQTAVRAALDGVKQDAPDSEAALSASVALARLDLDAGQPDAAITSLENYLAKVKSGGLRLFATETLGYAYEAKGDLGKAASTFNALKDEGAAGRALFHQARLAEKEGKKDEARKLYEQVIAEHDKELVAAEARSRLELLDLPPAGQGAFGNSEQAGQ